MKIISMFTAFLIHPFMLQSPDFTGSKSGVVINVKSAMDLSEKLVYIIIIIHKCIVLAASLLLPLRGKEVKSSLQLP